MNKNFPLHRVPATTHELLYGKLGFMRASKNK